MQLPTFVTTFWQARKSVIILAIILLLGLGLRGWGVRFGLPNLHHPDEDALVMPAINILKTGDLEPTRMEYGTFQIYLLTAVFVPVYLSLARNGRILAPQDLPIYERNSYPAFYEFPEFFLAARLVSVAMGVGIILLTYMLIRRLGNERQALIAAFLAAILPDLVAHSHFATPDIPLTFMGMLALYLIIRVYDNWSPTIMWAFAGAGFVAGLAASTKYNGVILIVPLMMVPLLRLKALDEWLRMRVLAGPIALVVGFLAGTPFALINVPLFLEWTGFTLHLYGQPAQGFSSWQWHLNYHLTGPHVVIFVMGLIGFVLSWWAWGRRGWIANVLVLFIWLGILTQTNAQGRMWLLSAPIFVGWVALVCDKVFERLRTRLKGSRLQLAAGIIALILIAPLGFSSIQADNRFRGNDVRDLTTTWIEQNLPDDAIIAVEYFSPHLNQERFEVKKALFFHSTEASWFTDEDIEYFVLSEALLDRDRRTPKQLQRIDELVARSCLLHTLNGSLLSAEPSDFYVYRIGSCP